MEADGCVWSLEKKTELSIAFSQVQLLKGSSENGSRENIMFSIIVDMFLWINTDWVFCSIWIQHIYICSTDFDIRNEI